MSGTDQETPTETGAHTTSEEAPNHANEHLEKLRKQIEFYFSRENLAKDQFLISQMTTMDLYVPLSIIASFSKVKALVSHMNNPLDSIRQAIQTSDVVSMNPERTQVKPNVKTERDTLILREIPSSTPKEQLEALFTQSGSEAPLEIRADIGDTWFVRMSSEKAATQAFSNLRSQKFEGKSVKARLKSENPLTKLLGSAPVPAAANTPQSTTVPGLGQSCMNPNSPEMYPMMGGQQGFGGAPMMTAAPMIGNYFVPSGQKNQSSQFGEFIPGTVNADRSGSFSSANSRRDRTDSITSHGSTSSASSFGFGDSIDIPEGPPPPVGYTKEFKKYEHNAILEIVKAMPKESLYRPESMDPKEHPRAVVEQPNTQLIEKQRTWSMDNALQQGRPRIDSVDSVNSADYSSMMYGEDRQNKKNRKAKADSDAKEKRMGKARSNSGYAAFSGKEKQSATQDTRTWNRATDSVQGTKNVNKTKETQEVNQRDKTKEETPNGVSSLANERSSQQQDGSVRNGSTQKPQGYAAALLASRAPEKNIPVSQQRSSGSTAPVSSNETDTGSASSATKSSAWASNKSSTFADIVKRKEEAQANGENQSKPDSRPQEKAKVAESKTDKPPEKAKVMESKTNTDSGSFRDFGGLNSGEKRGHVAFSSKKPKGRGDK